MKKFRPHGSTPDLKEGSDEMMAGSPRIFDLNSLIHYHVPLSDRPRFLNTTVGALEYELREGYAT